jgi:hypothetical protein
VKLSAKKHFAECLPAALGKICWKFFHPNLKLFCYCSYIILNKISMFGQLLWPFAIFRVLISFHWIFSDKSIRPACHWYDDTNCYQSCYTCFRA